MAQGPHAIYSVSNRSLCAAILDVKKNPLLFIIFRALKFSKYFKAISLLSDLQIKDLRHKTT